MEHLDLTRFQPSDKNEWLELAQQQLKGADPMERLSWNPQPEISGQPYYDIKDVEELNYLQEFFSERPTIKWKLYQSLSSQQPDKSNREALEALAGGCDGIIIDVADSSDESILLKGIDTNICDISILSGPKTLQPTGIGFDLRESTNASIRVNANDSVIDQMVELFTNYKGEAHVIRTASTDFFLEIASLRAIRYLLHKCYGADPWKIFIHTFVPVHKETDHQWFLNTTAGLAAVLGSSNSVCFHTPDDQYRISRNVGNLIREESGIVAYEDQCGGSYFVESLTHQLIEVVLNKLDQK